MARLEGKQILLVVGQKNYDEEEFHYLFETLEKEGADVFVASNTPEKALGRLEGYVTPDLTIAEANPEDYDAIVLVGGYGARVYLWDDPATHALLQKAQNAGKLIAALSTAPVALARAGILKNHRATVFPDYDSVLELKLSTGGYIHENVVVDDNIITGSHNRYRQEFTEAIISKLAG